VSLSNTDAVGHTWGPDSREIHDQILRLDRWLGWFMDSLAVLVPSDRTIYALTADHGVTSFPEYARANGRVAGRVVGDSVATRAELALEQRLGAGRRFGLQFDNGLLYGDTTALRSAGVNVDSLASALASQLARYTGVTRIHTPRTLAQAAEGDGDAMRWRRTIPGDFPWLAAASVAPGYIWSFLPGFTTHGTTNASDVLVPIAFLGPGIPPGRHERARTVDIAPTLAAIIGVKPAEAVEGIVLKEVVQKP
ncbi:MAG: alkaline phosphatase family protein, partial [Gemmatimonadales bacterium]